MNVFFNTFIIQAICWLADEGIDERSIMLLSDCDLKELGFKMGKRRLLVKWIVEQQQQQVQAESASGSGPRPVSAPMLLDSPLVSGSSETSSRQSTARSCVQFEMFFSG